MKKSLPPPVNLVTDNKQSAIRTLMVDVINDLGNFEKVQSVINQQRTSKDLYLDDSETIPLFYGGWVTI